jgi:hypothetical protein
VIDWYDPCNTSFSKRLCISVFILYIFCFCCLSNFSILVSYSHGMHSLFLTGSLCFEDNFWKFIKILVKFETFGFDLSESYTFGHLVSESLTFGGHMSESSVWYKSEFSPKVKTFAHYELSENCIFGQTLFQNFFTPTSVFDP